MFQIDMSAVDMLTLGTLLGRLRHEHPDLLSPSEVEAVREFVEVTEGAYQHIPAREAAEAEALAYAPPLGPRSKGTASKRPV